MPLRFNNPVQHRGFRQNHGAWPRRGPVWILFGHSPQKLRRSPATERNRSASPRHTRLAEKAASNNADSVSQRTWIRETPSLGQHLLSEASSRLAPIVLNPEAGNKSGFRSARGPADDPALPWDCSSFSAPPGRVPGSESASAWDRGRSANSRSCGERGDIHCRHHPAIGRRIKCRRIGIDGFVPQPAIHLGIAFRRITPPILICGELSADSGIGTVAVGSGPTEGVGRA